MWAAGDYGRARAAADEDKPSRRWVEFIFFVSFLELLVPLVSAEFTRGGMAVFELCKFQLGEN